MRSLFGVIFGESLLFMMGKKLLKYIEQKFVYKVSTKTNLRHKVTTAKEIDFDLCQ